MKLKRVHYIPNTLGIFALALSAWSLSCAFADIIVDLSFVPSLLKIALIFLVYYKSTFVLWRLVEYFAELYNHFKQVRNEQNQT